MERLPRLVLSSVTMLPPQLYWLPLLAALLPPVPAQKFSALTVSPEPHLCLPHSLGTHSPLLWDKVLGAGGRVSSNRWVWQSPMAWVFRVYSYSHVKGCWSYQYREEGSWHTGMSGAAPPLWWEWTSPGTSIWTTKVLQPSQDELTVTGHPPCQCRPILWLGSGPFSAWAPRGPTVPPFRWGKRLQPMGSTCGRTSPRHLIETRRRRYDIKLKIIFLLLKTS